MGSGEGGREGGRRGDGGGSCLKFVEQIIEQMTQERVKNHHRILQNNRASMNKDLRYGILNHQHLVHMVRPRSCKYRQPRSRQTLLWCRHLWSYQKRM